MSEERKDLRTLLDLQEWKAVIRRLQTKVRRLALIGGQAATRRGGRLDRESLGSTASSAALLLLLVTLAGGFVSGCTREAANSKASPNDSGKAPAKQSLADIKTAAEAGEPAAALELGKAYDSGTGVTRDIARAAHWYRMAAEKGLPEAQYRYGEALDLGLGVPRNRREANQWYEKAVELGHDFARRQLGENLLHGYGAEKNSSRAAQLFSAALPGIRRLAEGGSAEAQYELGMMFEEGEGVPKDGTTAVLWYRRAADQASTEARTALGRAYFNGNGVGKDPVEAVRLVKEPAERGYRYAQYCLGAAFLLGEGVPQNLQLGFEWSLKAANQGQAGAQRHVGICYLNGEGVPPNSREGLHWLEMAIDADDETALSSLAEAYLKGVGVPRDPGKAVELLLRGATREHVESLTMLGQLYSTGDGVPKDMTKAAEWFEKAANQGHAEAQESLGYLRWNGTGTPKDLGEAVRWYRSAAKQGRSVAQYNLALAYELGLGVPAGRNLVLAYAWYNLSAAQGYSQAETARDRVERSLVPAQIAEASRLSSAWKRDEDLGEALGADRGATPLPGPVKLAGGATAFVVSATGHAITNTHVVDGCAEVRLAGKLSALEVVARDAQNDLALVKIPGDRRPFGRLSPGGKLGLGEEVVVFGFPLEGVLSSRGNLTTGVVSAVTGLGDTSGQIQISASIQPGSSGSPVLSQKGLIVGVVVGKLSDTKMARATGSIAQNANFAIDGPTLRNFLDAHRVPYETGSRFFTRQKETNAIAEDAQTWVVAMECWKQTSSE